MKREEIAELRKLDRAPDGSCWYCKTVMRGHFEGCPVASLPRLLAEREVLVEAVAVCALALDGAEYHLTVAPADSPKRAATVASIRKASPAAVAALALAES